MANSIKIAVYANSDDAFVAWAPDEFIANCLGFQLERGQRTGRREKVEMVQNRVGFATDKAKSGDHRPSGIWPFQRFNWTDHAVDVGNEVRYRVTAMLRDGPGALTAGSALRNGRPAWTLPPHTRWSTSTEWRTLSTITAPSTFPAPSTF